VRLVSVVLGFALRKVGVLGVTVLGLFLGYLLIQVFVPTLQEALEGRDRLPQVTEERKDLESDIEVLERATAEGRSQAIASLRSRVAAEVAAASQRVADTKADVERRRAEQDEVCGFWKDLVSSVLPGDPCGLAEKAAETAEQTLATFERSLDQARRRAAVLSDPQLTDEQKLDQLRADGGFSQSEQELATKKSELKKKRDEERSLREAQESGAGWVITQWERSWRWLAAIALLALLMPPVLRTVSYFLLMPLLHRAHRPILLADGCERASASLRSIDAQRTLTIHLAPGEVLSARSEHVRPVQGTVRGSLLYDRSAPFVSFAAGLYGLSRVTGDEAGTAATLATPDDPDSYLMRIDFEDHPGVVMHPKHVVGVIGTPELETRWRWGILSLATWQVRYIMFAGTGSLIVQGSGDVVATDPGGRSTRMEQHLVMGFDSRLAVGVRRTEVFWPYLWGRTSLVDDEFTGPHPLFWQKSTSDGPNNPVAKAFDAVFSALGKLLGF
jgi:cell division septum initiation protein DivIVA